MKKLFLVLIFSATAVLCFAQAFDDLPFSNPDNITYFQQEMTSLMRFQAENNINIPFFASFSMKAATLHYQKDYLNSLYSDFPGFLDEPRTDISKGTVDMNMLFGAQIKINKAFYIPVFLSIGGSEYSRHLEEYIYTANMDNYGSPLTESVEYRTPAALTGGGMEFFFGGGAFINTDVIKGGIYLGWQFADSKEAEIYLPNPYHRGINNNGLFDNGGFKIALVPLVNTSGWKYVGKVLDNILGYLGNGSAVMVLAEEEGDDKTQAFVNALNAALEFTFNRIHLDPFSLDIKTVYARGNFDSAAKTDTYGLKLHGLFSNFPFGFTLEGGYKHFYSIAKYFEEDYADTGYFNGSVYFPFKHITFGLIYNYDSVNSSMITLALSTNFLSGFFGLNFFDKDRYDKDKYEYSSLPSGSGGSTGGSLGARFRWNGWKVKPKEK